MQGETNPGAKVFFIVKRRRASGAGDEPTLGEILQGEDSAGLRESSDFKIQRRNKA
jgi:hypothetical protein